MISRAAQVVANLAAYIVRWITIASLMLGSLLAPSAAFGEAAENLHTVDQAAHGIRALGRLDSTPNLKIAADIAGEHLDAEVLKSKLQRDAIAKPKEVMVGVGHTLLTMVILASAEMTAQQIKKNGGAPTITQMKDIALNVAKATVNSPEIYTSLLTAGVFGLLNKPAVSVMRVLAAPTLRASFIPLLARSITTTISFGGWEFGTQLWTEASLLLPTQEEREIAESSFGMSKGLMTAALAASHLRSNSKADQLRYQVARKMMTNMFLVIHTSTLRSELLYNFFRTDIMTGEFQSMLAGAIAAGAIGTAIFPGAGTLAGFIFGAVGIVAAQYLPQPVKDRITNGFQFARRHTIELMLSINYSKMFARLNPRSSVPASDLQFYLNRRANERSWWTTIVFEHMFLEARSGDFSRIQSHFNELKAFYIDQLNQIHTLQRINAAAMKDPERRKVLHRDEFRCQNMIDYADALSAAAQLDPRNSVLLKTIEAMESRGFEETAAVISWIQTA